MEVTTALIPSELLARYDALPYDGTYKRADDTLSTVFAEALAAVVNAIEAERVWNEHATTHPPMAATADCPLCPGGNWFVRPLSTRFFID